ncbi:hypothetical protein GALMADRAFT_144379 [Galerina marginata CBS 339.88]|uniref:Uncharacterized protein n=1 Tax=Galerina marginata (strain CBS 339.88) TaxID=685588 RepID=A0A067ST83_GALM3|nr:hypothetical protein GALMADRAFT_144379 [Galerina marginata CBS 339.88]
MSGFHWIPPGTRGGVISAHDDVSDDILRTEWAKSRARATRAKEEVLLLREEMRRVLAFLEWKAVWWHKRKKARPVGTELAEALEGFAQEQEDLQRALAVRFRAIWRNPLEDWAAAAAEDDGKEDGDDEEDEDEDEEEAPVPEVADDDPEDDEDDDMGE